MCPTGPPEESSTGEKEMLGLLCHRPSARSILDKVAELATHDSEQSGRACKGRRKSRCAASHRHPAEAQPGRQAVGGHAARGSEGQRRSHGVHHAVRAPAADARRRQGRAGARRWCCRKRTLRPRFRCRTSCRSKSRASTIPSLISIRVRLGGTAAASTAAALQNLFRAQAGRHRGPAAPGKAARLFGYPGCSGEGPPGQGIPRRVCDVSAAPTRWKYWPARRR